MIYRIVSDISLNYTTNRSSFCVKVVNGIILTYRGTFKHGKPKNTADLEMRASYIGLCLIALHLQKGDAVFIHTDVYSQAMFLLKKERFSYFSDLLANLRRKGVSIDIKYIDKHSRDLHQQCHVASRQRNRAQVKSHCVEIVNE